MRSFQQRLPDFASRGLSVAAISADPPDTATRHREKMGFSYAFLADTNCAVIARYDLMHKGAGPDGNDIARPAEFLVDTNGVVRWVNLTESVAVRARPDQVLKAFDQSGIAIAK